MVNFGMIVLGTPTARVDRHRLAGVVTVNGAPASKLIVVIDRLTMDLIAAKWSDPTTGVWEIKGIEEYPKRRLLVLGLDETGDFNAEVADFISQVASAGQPSYFSIYPPIHDSDHVLATSSYGDQHRPWFATDPNNPQIGPDAGGAWVSSWAATTNQKFAIDLGSSQKARRLLLENFHNQGTTTDCGIKNFSIYGTNSATAFANTDFNSLDDLTLLGTFIASPHVNADVKSPQYFSFSNDVAYRYFVLRIDDNHGYSLFMGFRHIALQIEDV